MLRGLLSPKINDVTLPIDRTFVKMSVKPFYKDSESGNGIIHRKFEFSSDTCVMERKYTINTELLTTSEINSILLLDGTNVLFYPHNDNPTYYEGYLSINQYNKNNKNRIKSLRLIFTTTNAAVEYVDPPFLLKVNTGFINKQPETLLLKINTGIGI